MKDILLEPERVIALAFGDSEFITPRMVSPAAIVTAQRRFLIPVVGQKLMDALLDGAYIILNEEYVEPALAEYVRVEMTPLTDPRRRDLLRRAREVMRRLSDHLEGNKSQYAEYESSCNILNKISLHGAVI